VTVLLDGQELPLPRGENLAAALLEAGVMPFRQTLVSGAPRGPFCMMGACFDCLIELDGVTRQACMLEVEEGMRLTRPRLGGGA
jgi:predicted molibdopterin-dependent oxidoreductase YjgC